MPANADLFRSVVVIQSSRCGNREFGRLRALWNSSETLPPKDSSAFASMETNASNWPLAATRERSWHRGPRLPKGSAVSCSAIPLRNVMPLVAGWFTNNSTSSSGAAGKPRKVQAQPSSYALLPAFQCFCFRSGGRANASQSEKVRIGCFVWLLSSIGN